MSGIRKHRGLKRYYKNLATENDLHKATWLDFDQHGNCFGNGHFHFDLKGYGNKSFNRRKPHLDKLFRHFDILEAKTKQFEKDFQIFSILLDFSSDCDALFLHTSNPNSSQFPFKISDLTYISTLKNQQLNNYIDSLEAYEKLYGQADEAFCLLFKKDVGQLL